MSEQQEMAVKVFRQWLEARAEQVVGQACLPSACPLANWLSEWYGKRFSVSVGVGCFVDDFSVYQDLPWWAEEVVQLVDARPPGSVLFGREVLCLLDDIFKKNQEMGFPVFS